MITLSRNVLLVPNPCLMESGSTQVHGEARSRRLDLRYHSQTQLYARKKMRNPGELARPNGKVFIKP